MDRWLKRMLNVVKRPESRLAAGVVLMGLSIAMLVNVALVSCEQVGGGGGAAAKPGLVDRGGAGEATLPVPIAPGTPGKADFRTAAIVGEPEMRVRVLTAGASVRLGGVKDLTIAPSLADGRAAGPATTVTGDVEIRRDAGGWRVQSGGRVMPIAGEQGLVVASVLAGQAVKVNGVLYPGRLRLVPRSDGGAGGVGGGGGVGGERSFDVVEHILLEEYLPGVVAKEMLTGWPLGAYQVQAVCARTYALHEKMRTLGTGGGPRAHFDVESSDRDQVYSGATTNALAIEAVRSTRGWVLTDGDQVLRAYFSSTCGGRTASARDTWPTGPGFEYNLAAPIQAARREFACEASPLFRWSVMRDRQELVQRLRTYGERNRLLVRQIKDLWTVEPLAFNGDARPSAFKVIEPGGVWYQLSGEQLRLALNQSVPPPFQANPGAPAAAATGFTEAATVGPMPEAAPVAAMVVPDVDRKTRVASSDLEFVGPRGGAAATIRGRGFGHGVGMCQYCAKAFADRGEDWRTTVLRFYPGARLASLY